MIESKPFAVKDFKNTLKNNFNSLLKSVNNSASRTLLVEVEKFFGSENKENGNKDVPITSVNAIYNKICRSVPLNNINSAKLKSIKQIIDVIDKYSFKKNKDNNNNNNNNNNSNNNNNINNNQTQTAQEHNLKESAILNLIKKSRNDDILEIGIKMQKLSDNIIETNNEKNFMAAQISFKLSRISKDLDNYITTSLNLNDPVELDKTDKRMIRSVIDVTHVLNGLNVDIKNKVNKPKNQEPK